jgi:hypothetical protein
MSRTEDSMKRLLVSAALATAIHGCGDDVQGETRSDTDLIRESDASVAPAIEVTNVGEACSHEQPCGGSAAECLTRSSTTTTYVGGYCTASCTTSLECGPGGVCPVAEAERANPAYDLVESWPRKCFKSCTPGPTSGCRADYHCISLAEAYRRPNAPAPMQQPICVPSGGSPELGVDAGGSATH